MDWQDKLISTYCIVCHYWEQGLDEYAKRMSNNQTLKLTDQEIMTIYINGIMNHRHSIKDIYNFTSDHLRSWFPNLSSYEAFSHRLNQIHGAFSILSEMLLSEGIKNKINNLKENVLLLDSLPVVMAKAFRSVNAKVAKEIADKGYCASKDLHYHGIKIHIFAHDVDNSIPFPGIVKLTEASTHDLTAAREIFENLYNCEIYCDKAYCDNQLKEKLENENNAKISTPVKLSRSKKRLDFFEKLYSTGISRIRQPIESLFNWLTEKTGIQNASKVRSYKGLMVHVFGRLAAGLMMLSF
jgi:hypothetical protein